MESSRRTAAPSGMACGRMVSTISGVLPVGMCAVGMGDADPGPPRTRAMSGHVFSGVGIGIAFAGLFGLAAGLDAWSSRLTWIVLGALATALAMLLWRPLAAEITSTVRTEQPRERALPRAGHLTFRRSIWRRPFPRFNHRITL